MQVNFIGVSQREWVEKKEMHSSGIGYPIKGYRVVDIDTLDDWNKAQALFNYFEIAKS